MCLAPLLRACTREMQLWRHPWPILGVGGHAGYSKGGTCTACVLSDVTPVGHSSVWSTCIIPKVAFKILGLFLFKSRQHCLRLPRGAHAPTLRGYPSRPACLSSLCLGPCGLDHTTTTFGRLAYISGRLRVGHATITWFLEEQLALLGGHPVHVPL